MSYRFIQSNPLHARSMYPLCVQAQGGGDMKSPSMSPAQPRGPGAPGQGAAAGRNDPAGAREEVSDFFFYDFDDLTAFDDLTGVAVG